jgi:hypothetical protein
MVLVTSNEFIASVVVTGNKLVPMTPSAAVSDFGSRRYHRFFPICRKNRPLLSIQFIASEKFTGGVVLKTGLFGNKANKRSDSCQTGSRYFSMPCSTTANI